MIDASPSQATLAASLSDLLVNHQHASVIGLPRHFIPSFFSTSAMSFCFFAHQRCLSIIIKGEKCCTPFTFLNRYGHTLHCIAHKSVQLRSIVYHLAALNLLFFSRKAVALHSRNRPLCATSFRPLLRKDIALHSITLSFRSFSMTLRAMEKSYITTSLHYIPLHIHSLRVRQCLLFPIRRCLHGLVKLRFLLSVNARKPSD